MVSASYEPFKQCKAYPEARLMDINLCTRFDQQNYPSDLQPEVYQASRLKTILLIKSCLSDCN